jgi:signal transduction histidine kinase/CHASE3 domain sensor protein
MQWPGWNEGFESKLRLGLLAIAVAASVLLPYSLIRRSAEDTLEASAWVMHSAEVKQALYELRYNLNELESLVLLRYSLIDPDEGRANYGAIRARIDPLLRKLTGLTLDNPEQQNRIGSLEVLVQGRVKLFDAVLRQIEEKNFDAASASLEQAATMFPSHEVARQVVVTEDALSIQRNARMRSVKRTAAWIVSAALLAQLILLAAVIFVSERHLMHRRAAEKRARRAIERSRTIVQTLREPIAVLDGDLRVLTSNAAFVELYAAPQDEGSGDRLDQQGDGAWSNPLLLQRLLDVATRGREIWDFELTQTGRDGDERIVLANARRMELSEDGPNQDGRTILLSVTDVTARKRYEQHITDLNDELAAKVEQISEINRELESFSYSISHDLRAPLRHIAGFADKLGVHIAGQADDKARHYLDIIGDATRRMSALIEDLLEFSRLGRGPMRQVPVDMNALVAEQVRMFESVAGERTIDWHIGRLPGAIGDEGMLQRVWQNLISNAVKYTARRARAEIRIGADSAHSGEIVYYVADNGTGFDMAYAGKLFGVFQRMHKAADFPGTGIGLANVRRIVGRLGGRTWAEAKPDVGATFYFSLPVLAGALPLTEVEE